MLNARLHSSKFTEVGGGSGVGEQGGVGHCQILFTFRDAFRSNVLATDKGEKDLTVSSVRYISSKRKMPKIGLIAIITMLNTHFCDYSDFT